MFENASLMIYDSVNLGAEIRFLTFFVKFERDKKINKDFLRIETLRKNFFKNYF